MAIKLPGPKYRLILRQHACMHCANLPSSGNFLQRKTVHTTQSFSMMACLGWQYGYSRFSRSNNGTGFNSI